MILSAVGLRAIRRPAEASVVGRLAAGAGLLSLLLIAASLVSMTLGPVNIPIMHVAGIVLEPTGLHLADYGVRECSIAGTPLDTR